MSYEFNTHLEPGICCGFGSGDVQTGTSMYRLGGYFHDYRNNWHNIRRCCWEVYYRHGLVRSAVDYRVSLPTLDRTIQTKDRKRDGMSLPINYKKNKQKFSATLDRVREKMVASDLLLKMNLDGMAAYYFATDQQFPREKFLDPLFMALHYEINESGNKYSDKNFEDFTKKEKSTFLGRIDKYIEQKEIEISSKKIEENAVDIGVKNCSLFALPVDYIRVVGRRNNSYVIAFDLNYFLCHNIYEMSERLMQWPRDIRNAWRRWQSGRTRSQWYVLDNFSTVVVKTGAINESCGIPIVAGALEWVNYLDKFNRTKRNVMTNFLNSSFIWQELPSKDSTNNISSLSEGQQKDQHEKIKSTLNAPNINDEFIRRFVTVAPGTSINQLEFKGSNLFDKDNETSLPELITGALNVSYGSLTGSGNYAAMKLNADVINAENMIYLDQFAEELNKVINYHIIKDDSCYIEYKYIPSSVLNRQEFVGRALDLYRNASGSLEYLSSTSGLDLESMQSLMEEERVLGYEKIYQPHLTSFTATQREVDITKDEVLDVEENIGGRPQLDNTEVVNPSTEVTHNNDGNNMPKQSTI